MPRGPRALVFDFDGVIADDEPLHLAAFQEALAAEGIALTREAYYARYLGFAGGSRTSHPATAWWSRTRSPASRARAAPACAASRSPTRIPPRRSAGPTWS